MSGLGWKKYRPTAHEQDWTDRITLAVFGGITVATIVALLAIWINQ